MKAIFQSSLTFYFLEIQEPRNSPWHIGTTTWNFRASAANLKTCFKFAVVRCYFHVISRYFDVDCLSLDIVQMLLALISQISEIRHGCDAALSGSCLRIDVTLTELYIATSEWLRAQSHYKIIEMRPTAVKRSWQYCKITKGICKYENIRYIVDFNWIYHFISTL